MWKIDRIVSAGGYDYAAVQNHPNSNSNGYVYHHRIVMENSIGRLLNDNEVVHHINGNKKDNNIENLQLMTAGEHVAHHNIGKTMVKLKCPICRAIFYRRKGNTHLIKGGTATCCSRKCGFQIGLARRKNRITKDLELAIQENVIKIYKDNQLLCGRVSQR